MNPHDHCPIARRCPLRNLSIRGAEDTCETFRAFVEAILALHQDAIVEHRARMAALLRGDFPEMHQPRKHP